MSSVAVDVADGNGGDRGGGRGRQRRCSLCRAAENDVELLDRNFSGGGDDLIELRRLPWRYNDLIGILGGVGQEGSGFRLTFLTVQTFYVDSYGDNTISLKDCAPRGGDLCRTPVVVENRLNPGVKRILRRANCGFRLLDYPGR
nr:hypothetical protein Iba_chr12aCG11630 [Ipomoea batatas]